MLFSCVKISCFCAKACSEMAIRMWIGASSIDILWEQKEDWILCFCFLQELSLNQCILWAVVFKSFCCMLWRSDDIYFHSTLIRVLFLNCGIVWSVLRPQMSQKPSPKKRFFNWVVLSRKVCDDSSLRIAKQINQTTLLSFDLLNLCLIAVF